MGADLQNGFFDEVLIEDFHVLCIVGLLPVERIKPQKIILNIVMYTDLSSAMTKDYDLSKSINYADAAVSIKDLCIKLHAGTLEYLAGEIIQTLRIKFFPMLRGVSLKIIKPGILPDAQVGIKVVRYFSENRKTTDKINQCGNKISEQGI